MPGRARRNRYDPRVRRLVVVVALLVAAAGIAAGVFSFFQGRTWRPSVREVAAPVAAGLSAEPQLTALEGRAILSWVERSGDHASLEFSEWIAPAWTLPRLVAEGDDWFVNWADVPSVVRLSAGTMAAHWLQKTAGDPYAYDVRLAFSRDDGRTWSPSVTPHHDGTPNEHGFASLFAAPGGGLGLVWLDGRAMRPGPGGGEAEGPMSIRGATFSADGAQLSESLIDDRVCECCPTAAVNTSDGAIVAFRNRGDDETRDIQVARFERGQWTTASTVHDDGWRIDACPVNGPALSADGRDVAIAWFNAREDQGHAFVAFSHDGGRSFSRPVRVDDTATLGRVDVQLVDPRTAIAAWIEYASGRAQLRVRRVEESRSRSEAVTVAGLDAGRASGYPRLVKSGNDLLLAWTETGQGTSRVRTAVIVLE
jgi:hypothetical protein